ncbi:MAG TPA: PDZ domain-containing protein [Thiothrix sp.]|nr:PDZ domain-containing protein [Thiothrix sp.]
MTIISRYFVIVLLLATALSGCSSLSKVLPTQKARLPTILPELIPLQIVLVGESHTSYADHQTQLAVIKALHPHWPNMGIGVEFVQSPFQGILDKYVAGKLTDEQMLKQTHWYKRWRYDFRLYRDIFHYAKAHHIPLLALNAPIELTRKISKNGIKGLNANDRKQLPKKITATKAYRERLLKIFQQHAHGNSKGIDNFVDVQLAWDASMAENANKAIHVGKVKNIVLLAGSGHVIRQAIPARLNYSSSIIVNQKPEGHKTQVDYVLQQNKHAKLPASGKIGVQMVMQHNTIKISKVLESHKAGLKKDDQIVAINGARIQALEDIKIALWDKKVGDIIDVKIKRGKRTSLEKKIKLL